MPCEDVSAAVLPGAMGIYQVTGRVPKGLPDGDLPLVLEIGGKRSQSGLLVTVTSKPVILAIVNAASNMPGLVSGSWVSLYGRNLAATRREWTEDDIIYDWLPTSLDGAIVAINGTPAVMSYVSPFQVNVLAPDDLPLGPVEVTIQSSQGWQRADAVVNKYAPGFFPLLAPPGNYVIALHTDWSLVYRPGAPSPFPTGTPARPGEVIIFYGTGFGPTTPAVTTQKRFSGSAPLVSAQALSIQIGGKPAEVSYAGLVGNGLYQINVTVPNLPDGDHEVVAVIGGGSEPQRTIHSHSEVVRTGAARLYDQAVINLWAVCRHH